MPLGLPVEIDYFQLVSNSFPLAFQFDLPYFNSCSLVSPLKQTSFNSLRVLCQSITPHFNSCPLVAQLKEISFNSLPLVIQLNALNFNSCLLVSWLKEISFISANSSPAVSMFVSSTFNSRHFQFFSPQRAKFQPTSCVLPLDDSEERGGESSIAGL